MNIRSITLGLTREQIFQLHNNQDISAFFDTAVKAFQESGHQVRTMRVVLPVLNSWLSTDINSNNTIIKWISNFCSSSKIRWFCLPIDCSDEVNLNSNLTFAYECLRRYPNIFINLQFSSELTGAFQALTSIARFIINVSKISANGFDNFRLGISCNCNPNTPFFPYTFHDGDAGFSLAIENSYTFYSTIDELNLTSPNLIDFRNIVIEKSTNSLAQIEEIANTISSSSKVAYKGMDISLAPFPEKNGSIAGIIEKLSQSPFGTSGTIFYISFLTDILKDIIAKSGIKTTGFNGVMLSLLEDQNLSQANSFKLFSLDSLLSYSTVCGCGLDMVPIPGNTLVEEICGIILDIFAISTKLDKPLGIRLLPIPGKGENEFTNFNYDFIYNSRIAGVRNKSIDVSSLEQLKQFQYLRKYRR